jgi:2-polyprenyl-3-methyl-5-hydroxy-6-metoxy-1,4-benzoquinol methylase
MSKAEKFWDRQANSYDQEGDNNGGDSTFTQAVAITQKYLKETDVVLDYGCATGSLSFAITDLVQAVEGIDISAKMIARARQKAKTQQIANVRFEQTTIFETSYAKESFDVVLAFNVLHLLEDAHSAVQKINHLLKPDGLFISTTPCLGEKRTITSVVLTLMSKTGLVPRISKFKSAELERFVDNNGFQIVMTKILSSDFSETLIVARKTKA